MAPVTADPQTGRTSIELLPRFDTITYRQLWQRAGAVASALAGDPVAQATASRCWVLPASTTPSLTWR
jgi:long-subunit acyl-CoA synthetase (AMP-forming)